MAQDLGAIPGSREPSPGGLGPSGFDPGRCAELHAAFMAGWLTGHHGNEPTDAWLEYLDCQEGVRE